MSFLPRFRLPPASREHVVATGPSAPPEPITCLDFRVDDGSSRGNIPDARFLASSRSKGSFNWDREHGGFSLEWANYAEFETWRRVEELASSIEFIVSTSRNDGILWSQWKLFVCGRQDSGGVKEYEKKYPERERKIGIRKSGCRCQIVIKQYHHTSTVLGRYVAEHDHEIGAANIAYTRLSGTTRERIKIMLDQKIDRYEIARKVRNESPDGTRDQLISLKEINHIAFAFYSDKMRLHPDDAISTRLLIERLSARGTHTFYKDKQDRTPIELGLPQDAFILCIQTSFQLDAFRRLGSGFIGIDATHNTTQYQNLLLFTIIARDHWGQGVPVAWMLTSSATTEVIKFFLEWVKDVSPGIRPRVIMTDRDQAQIAALGIVYPQSQIFLCRWHVLRAMRCHFVTSEFQALWEKIKAWVMTENVAEFHSLWESIYTDPSVPQSVIKYLTKEWIPVVHMWSKVARKGRSIYEEGDTNMLIESYHHVLKSHHLGGKRNWRVDHVVQVLTTRFQSEFENRYERQDIGLEGPDLEGTRRRQILTSARTISPDSINQITNTKFSVASQSLPGHHYAIDLDQLTCNCNDFPRIRFCKHIATITVHFPKVGSPSKAPERVRAQDPPVRARNPPQRVPKSDEENIDILLRDINALCQELNSASVGNCTPDLEALKSVRFSLKAAINSASGSRALPEKDDFHPKRNTWTETTDEMGSGGAKRPSKQQPGPVDAGTNTTNTEERIGAVKGKRSRKHSTSDSYAAGERSGKRAKPDAVSAAANERVRATAPIAAPSQAAVLAPARASLSPAPVGSAARPFTHASQSVAVPLPYPPSSAVPGLALSHLSAASAGPAFAPFFASVTGSAYTGIFAPTHFRGQIKPGNALAHAHFPSGPST